jgi:hypothetical protein
MKVNEKDYPIYYGKTHVPNPQPETREGMSQNLSESVRIGKNYPKILA